MSHGDLKLFQRQKQSDYILDSAGGSNQTPKGGEQRPDPPKQQTPGTFRVPVDLSLTRQPSNALATLGYLDVDGVPFCHTLEDPVRDLGEHGEGKIYGKTAIPAGRYPVLINWSVKFQKKMLAVEGVPYFTGIRIHSGNDADDTLGCILVGSVVVSPTRIHGGSTMLPQLLAKVQQALDKGGKVWLTIHDAPQVAG